MFHTLRSVSLRRLATLALAGAVLGSTGSLALAPLSATTAEPATAQDDTKKKKRKRQRGKVVKATVVPVEAAPAGDEEAEAPAEPAQAEAAEPEQPEAAPAAQAEAAPSTADREAEAKEARRAEKAERERAKREQAAQEKADRQAAKEQAARDREDRRTAEREAQQAEQAAKAEAARTADAQRRAAREAERTRRAEAADAAEAQRAEEAAAAEPQRSASAPADVPRAAAAPATPPPAAPVATTAAAGDVSETIQVREVLLDVLVTDRKGNVIEGLAPGDFEVTEGGEPVEVTSLTFYGGANELANSGVGNVRTDRYFILFFHDQAQAAGFLRSAQLDNARWAQKWIETELQPNDQVAVLGYDVRLKVYQDFSTDPVLLSQAVAAASKGEREPDRWRTEQPDPARTGSPSLLLNLPKGQALAKRTRRLQHALELVGRASEGIVGRKNLMLFSAGFGDIDSIGVWTPDPRFYPPMKQSLNTGNVAVYGIDLLGSRRGSPGSRDINDALSAIANDTGGHYYSTYANALAPLRNVARDNMGYYLLSYRSRFEVGTSGYREVKVKVKKTDKKLRVRARKGYRFGT